MVVDAFSPLVGQGIPAVKAASLSTAGKIMTGAFAVSWSNSRSEEPVYWTLRQSRASISADVLAPTSIESAKAPLFCG